LKTDDRINNQVSDALKTISTDNVDPTQKRNILTFIIQQNSIFRLSEENRAKLIQVTKESLVEGVLNLVDIAGFGAARDRLDLVDYIVEQDLVSKMSEWGARFIVETLMDHGRHMLSKEITVLHETRGRLRISIGACVLLRTTILYTDQQPQMYWCYGIHELIDASCDFDDAFVNERNEFSSMLGYAFAEPKDMHSGNALVNSLLLKGHTCFAYECNYIKSAFFNYTNSTLIRNCQTAIDANRNRMKTLRDFMRNRYRNVINVENIIECLIDFCDHSEKLMNIVKAICGLRPPSH